MASIKSGMLFPFASTSGTLGSVPNLNSATLEKGSPSGLPNLSDGSRGSKPLSVSQSLGMSSPSMSVSQASPTPSLSKSPCGKLGTLGQLSELSGMESLSVSSMFTVRLALLVLPAPKLDPSVPLVLLNMPADVAATANETVQVLPAES